MPTTGGGDDFVWIGGPDEGLWLLVVVGDEAIDGGLEIDDAFEDAALEALSLRRPSTPSDMNRSCQRQTAVLLTPTVRMIVAVPSPSAVASTIRARQTCFWGLLRSSTIACRRLRSVGLR